MNPDLTPEELARLRKPAPDTGREDRYGRRLKRKALKAKADKLTAQVERQRDKTVRHHCYLRDRKRCRVFGTPVLFDTDNLLKLAHNHHIVFRSAGGSDDTSNRITLGPKAHRMVHEGYLEIEGDADALVTIRQYEFSGGTRHLVREWQA